VKTWTWMAMLIVAALDSSGGLLVAESVETMLAPATVENPRNSEGDVIALRDGALLAAWSEFTGGARDDSRARIAAARSADGGRTWGPRFTLQENVGAQNVMSVSLLRSRSGEILFFYGVKNSPRELYFMVRRSRDEAQTWSEPVRVIADPGYYVMNNARVVQLSSGRILCPTSFTEEVWTRKEQFRTVMYYSDDDGRTWRRGRGVAVCPQRGAMEPGLLELRDGRLLQIIRTQMGEIWHSHSSDGGDTWTEARPWTVRAPEAPSTLVRLPGSGELLLIYNPVVKLGTDHSGPRTPLVAALSRDEGKTWSRPKEIELDRSATYAYTSVTFHGESALLTYYVSRDKRLSLKFKSLALEWFRTP
jgi:sialidase-1